MNSADITKAKFCVCLNPFICSHFVGEMDDNMGHTFIGGVDLDALSDLMIKNNLKEYSNLLFDYLNWQLTSSKSTKSFFENVRKFDEMMEEEIKFQKDLAESLHFLLSRKEGDITSITFQSQTDKTTIWNKKIVESILKKLIEDFKENGYDQESLTEDDAEEEIRQGVDLEWIKDWGETQKGYDSNGDLIEISDFESGSTEGFDHDNYFVDNTISKKMKRVYAETHEKTREIDLELIKKIKIEGGFDEKKKAGAKGKMKHVKSLMIDLSYLCRIDEFLQSKEDVTDIEQIELTPENCQFIYDCLNTIGFVDILNTSPPKKYIKSALKSAMVGDRSFLFIPIRNNILTQLKSKIKSMAKKS